MRRSAPNTLRGRGLTCLSPGLVFGGSASSKPATAARSNGASPGPAPGPAPGEYNRQLTALNCSVRDWIAKHVNDNPLCDLQPIFRDYERHLASIERQYGTADAGSEEKPASPAAASSPPAAALFSFTKGAAEVKAPPGVTFNFGQKVDSSVLGSTPSPSGFSFTPSTQSSLFAAAPSLGKSEEPRAAAGTTPANRK